MKAKLGAPVLYDKDKYYDAIIQAISKVLVLGQVAGLVEVHRSTLSTWIINGDNDRKEGISSDLAHLSTGVRKAQALVVEDLIKTYKRGKSYAKWLLEVCFREDFGIDAGVISELLAKCDKLEQAFKRFNESSPIQQGQVVNG